VSQHAADSRPPDRHDSPPAPRDGDTGRGKGARLIAPGGYAPLHVVGPLAADAARLGIETLHLYTFNSVAETVA
jgi:hypothetical protein